MQLNDLNITFLEHFTVRDFQSINKLNIQFNKGEIDEIQLSNELMKLCIFSINGETDKEKIENLILSMEDLTAYSKLNEEIAKRINSIVDPLKKRNRIRIF